MSFCTECGFKLPDNAVFCPNCGTSVATKYDNCSQKSEIPPQDEHISGEVPTSLRGEYAAEKSSDTTQNEIISGEVARAAQGKYTTEDGKFYAAPKADPSPADYGYPRTGEPDPKPSNKKRIIAIAISAAVLILLVLAFMLSSAGGIFHLFGRAHDRHKNMFLPSVTIIEPNTEIAGSGNVGGENFYIEIVGATHFTDTNGNSAMRVFYNFTNNSTRPISAWEALNIVPRQDGHELKNTYSWQESDIYYNHTYAIIPGTTIRCAYEFLFNPSGGNVDILFVDSELDAKSGKVMATYSPENLPGAPEPFVIKPITDPQWTKNRPAEGTLGDVFHVSVLDAELISDFYGNPAIRIYYEFTNNSEVPATLSDELRALTYQDGIQLEYSSANEDSESDFNFIKSVAPGTKVKASAIFALRNETSPVEAEISSSESYDAVGQTYAISEK
ncbi:MAG: DUF5067 domain-containing protein [Oscillospiraceae bacterium]